MSSSQPGNVEYIKKIINTDLSKSKVGDALLGTFPSGYKVIKACIDFTEGQAVADGLALVDSVSGNQVLLSEGDIITDAKIYTTTPVASGGAPTFDVGFSLAPASGTSPAVATAFTNGSAASLANVNTLGFDLGPLVVTSDNFLAIDVNTAPLTAGFVCVVLHVVSA